METQALRDTYKTKFLAQSYMDMYGHYPPEAVVPAARQLRGIFHSGKLCLTFEMFLYVSELYPPRLPIKEHVGLLAMFGKCIRTLCS